MKNIGQPNQEISKMLMSYDENQVNHILIIEYSILREILLLI